LQQQPSLQMQASCPLQEQLWRCQHDINRSSAAAAAGGGSSGSVPFAGGEEDVQGAFKLIKRLVGLLKDMRDRCR
jgi:hypothetical protein